MSNQKISIAKKMLMTIEESTSLKKLLTVNSISYATEEELNELENFLNDEEETVDDYMTLCGYTESEAYSAYENLSNY